MTSQKAILLLLSALICTTNGRDFLSANRRTSASVRTEVDGVLAEVLGMGHGVVDARLSKIHQTLKPLFHALPKNKQGRVSSTVMRYAVRRYFSQNHGWIVKGFSPHEELGNASSAVDTDILQSKLPGYIRSILEERFAHEGFSLDAVVAMVASVERLAFDEVARGVELAFYLNDIDRTAVLSIGDMFEILSSYLITEMLEGAENKEKHYKDKQLIFRRYPFWGTTILFLQDTISSHIFEHKDASNPFAVREYSFEDVIRIAERINKDFGFWSNHECHEMKEMLMEIDTHETGRVKLADFYSYSKDGAWQFLEPSEQLRLAGALDETSAWLGPQVMISNYIHSLSNCITSTPYYSICCLNECDQVFQQLESRIAAPSATAMQIITALESGIDAPNITTLHIQRLDEIAKVTGDQILIYGRLFARWLHFVYPRECPYPHAPGVVKPLSQQDWLEMVGEEDESVSDEEVSQHLESEHAHRDASPDAGAAMWNLEESHMVSSTPSDFSPASSIRALLRIAAQIGMFGGMLVALLSVLKPLMQRLHTGTKTKLVEYDV